jgi:hypothetical protein
MWIPEHRRNGLCYPSDPTDEWAPVAPMIPPEGHGGRERSVNIRELLSGIFYAALQVPVEGIAERPAAEEYGARLSRALELGRHVGALPSRALCCGARARRT